MKFKVIRSTFLEGLKSVQNVVDSKVTLPILKNVLLEGKGGELVLTTTDLDLSARATIPCEVGEEGSSTLDVKILSDLISAVAEGEIEVSIDQKERATIQAGSTTFKIAGLPSSDFPRLPKDEDAFTYTIDQAVLKELFRKVSYAASQDDTRRTLKGVLMSFKDAKVTMVATDGRRLARVETPLEFPPDFEKDVILPSKAVQEVQRALTGDTPIKIMIQKSQICFSINSVIIYSKLMDEVYPNYTQVIPKETTEEIAVDRQGLLDALSRASAIGKASSIKLIFSDGKLTVTSSASNVGEAKDEVPVKYMGEKIEIIFNPTYVMDPLKVIDDNEVTIHLNNGHSPAVITCSIPFLYVIMPLRIS